ncbi:MAG TPA: hypothetical protein VEU32_05825, partial [Burkholderiales bacterium]|nr:hypothetical protein [Burkholderiales bacterium]
MRTRLTQRRECMLACCARSERSRLTCVKGAHPAKGHSECVRIQVDCRTRKGASEPRSFVLGHHKLWVLRVLEQHQNTASRRFK